MNLVASLLFVEIGSMSSPVPTVIRTAKRVRRATRQGTGRRGASRRLDVNSWGRLPSTRPTVAGAAALER